MTLTPEVPTKYRVEAIRDAVRYVECRSLWAKAALVELLAYTDTLSVQLAQEQEAHRKTRDGWGESENKLRLQLADWKRNGHIYLVQIIDKRDEALRAAEAALDKVLCVVTHLPSCRISTDVPCDCGHQVAFDAVRVALAKVRAALDQEQPKPQGCDYEIGIPHVAVRLCGEPVTAGTRCAEHQEPAKA